MNHDPIKSILEEIKEKWEREKHESGTTSDVEDIINELSIGKLQSYKAAIASPDTLNSRDMLGIAKGIKGFKRASDKIAIKTGDRSGNRPLHGPIAKGHTPVGEDFTDILNKQQAETKKKMPVKDIPYHGWTIRYRPASEPNEKVKWIVLDRKHNQVHSGESMSDKEAVGDAEEWIKSGGGTKKVASSNVTIDYNSQFTSQFSPDGDTLYVMFDTDNNVPVIYISTEPQAGFRKTHNRHSASSQGDSVSFLSSPLTASESNKVGFQPNGRYILGGKIEIDSSTSAYPLIFQGQVADKRERVRLSAPGFTVAHARDIDEDCWDGYEQIGMKEKGEKQVPNCVPKTNEVYMGPWQGDPQAYAKAPKSTTKGTKDVPLSSLVKDTVRRHGVKWAFDYYVNKHGMPPRHFRIYSGI